MAGDGGGGDLDGLEGGREGGREDGGREDLKSGEAHACSFPVTEKGNLHSTTALKEKNISFLFLPPSLPPF